MALCLPGGSCYPTYPTQYQPYPPPYNPYYWEPSLFRVQYKIPSGLGALQRYEITVQGFTEYDAFQQAIRYMPPFSQITNIRRLAMHPHP
ncbi:hypothetical protein [[Eubacterium] cellulosolvens]